MTDEFIKTLKELHGIVNNFVIRGSGVSGNLKTGWTVNPGSGQLSSGSRGGITPGGCFRMEVSTSATFGEDGSCSGSGSDDGCASDLIEVTGCDIGCIDFLSGSNYHWTVRLQLISGSYNLALVTARADNDPCVDSAACSDVVYDLGVNPIGVHFYDLGENCFIDTGDNFTFTVTISAL